MFLALYLKGCIKWFIDQYILIQLLRLKSFDEGDVMLMIV